MGQVGITLNIQWAQPKNSSDEAHREASDRAIQFELGWFAHPVLVNGDYPQVMKDKIGNKSLAQGYTESRLPTFSEREKRDIKGEYRCTIPTFSDLYM
jgi:lactase-phlorizin hydrolase